MKVFEITENDETLDAFTSTEAEKEFTKIRSNMRIGTICNFKLKRLG